MKSDFDDDKWLLIDNMIINKNDNTVHLLDPDGDATIDGIADIFYHGPYTYSVEFEDNAFRLYTFLETYYYPEGSDKSARAFFDCVFTYDPDGHETDRTYLSEPLTKQEMLSLYNSRYTQSENFSFAVDALWEYDKDEYEYISSAEQVILEYAENIYNESIINESLSGLITVAGTAKTSGDDILFSVTVIPKILFPSGNPILDGISKSEIIRYDSESEEFESVFEYNKMNSMIVDFDGNGLYIFDNNRVLKYFDIESGETTSIHKFAGQVYSFEITDNYIGATYEDNETGYCFFAYEKGNAIVADDLYSEYSSD